MRKLIMTAGFLFLSLLGTPLPVQAEPALERYIPHAGPVGEGRLQHLLWDVYDATLYASEGSWSPDKPFALSLRYLRDIAGTEIADYSAKTIRAQGFEDEVRLAAWHSQMRQLFPDVKPGMTLTGIYRPGKPTIFLQDGEVIGSIQDENFGRRFFNIWLAEDTPAPELRRQLLRL